MKKLLILTFFTILTILILASTYGVFESKVLNGSKIKIASWNVQINDSIVTNEKKTFTIDDIICNDSEDVLNGKMAPGIEGYFDIMIDLNNTDVSIKYDIIYDVEYLESINKAFTIIEVEELSDKNLVKTDKNTYTGIIRLDGENHIIRTHVKWEDIIDNGYNDYLTGTSNSVFELPINIIVSQYIGEDIIEYNEE